MTNPLLLRGAVRAVSFLAFTLICIVLALPARLMPPFAFDNLRKFWCVTVCWLLGIKVEVRGRPFVHCPTLFAANHVSYLDILIMGRTTTAAFIAKSEIAHWPLFGLIAKIDGTMFIRRHWRDVLLQRNRLMRRLDKGDSMILFAEGTSTDGLSVTKFKSSLFSVAEPWVIDKPIAVQPVTLAYRALADGSSIDASNAERYAWVGDAEFVPHLWQVLQSDGVEIVICFDEPVMSWPTQSRKALAAQMQETVARNLARLQADCPSEVAAPLSGTARETA